MTVYEVANIEEAVELAYQLKAEGRYDWFRGQVRDWPPVSSAYRVRASGDAEKVKMAEVRYEMFFEWLGTIPELRHLQRPENDHDCFAIMQHYGIPTHYIDFTIDPGVAGFFAADTTSPPTEGKSCIYCLNTSDLMSLWNAMKDLDARKGASVELVTIDVRNLWRLKAQHGVFLASNYRWDIDYPMDRIVFPYSGYPSSPTRVRIYPKDKSPLEQLLDQYFDLEASRLTTNWLKDWIIDRTARGNNASYAEWEVWPEGFYAEAFIDGAHLTPLESWNPDALQPWEIDPEEDYHQSIGPTLELRLTPGAESAKIRKSVSFGVRQILRSDPVIRSKTVNWVFTDLPASLSQEELNVALRPVWNGMRRLPYTDDEIADAFGSVSALLMIGCRKEATSDGQMKLFSQCFGECMKVGFANRDGSGSLGFAAHESLREALRPDMAELVAPEYMDFAKDAPDLFKIIYNPRLMFKFNEFKSMFAREVIPAQVVLQRQLILFNPTRLMTFGIP